MEDISDKILLKAKSISYEYDAMCAYVKTLLHHFCNVDCDGVEQAEMFEDLGKVVCRCANIKGNMRTTFWSEIPLQAFVDPFAYAKDHAPNDAFGFCADMKHSFFLEMVEKQ